jgi:hypothetical protein
LRLGELWRNKDLVLLFMRRDFVSVDKQSIGGVAINPLLYNIRFMLVVFFLDSVIFNRVERTFMDTA